MKNLPIGIQTFRDIIQNDYLYVDKTEKIFDLVKNPKGVYFLSRPRRFGKSLLISTLNEIFEGEKELFKDLWIYNSDYDWEKHPVVRIDFSRKKAENKDDLKGFIPHQLKNIANKYGVLLERDQYTVFYLIFSLIGLKVEAEVKTNIGRIDAVIIDKDVYIFEFKFNGDKDKVLRQIKEKKYFEKYQGAKKEIYLFGVEFTDRNVGDWVVEKEFICNL